MSPGYGGGGNRQPYSPQLVSPQQQNFAQGAYQQQARLSPQFGQQMQLRQAYPSQGSNGGGQGGQQTWQQSQQQQARLSLQNPMLNAQLTVSARLY